MEVRHGLDLEIREEKVSFKSINLKEGDNYGCFIFIATYGVKCLSLRFTLYPDWSETSLVKPISVKINGKDIFVTEVFNNILMIIYEAIVEVDKCAYVEVFSNNNPYLDIKYPTLMVDSRRKIYSIIDKADTCSYVELF
ncbi:SWPV1-269 [Shearwaterpox virus]|uniref:SWPV1-269 n=1 Tax=Shearwaterpox virus TaxID=1974596 RepID=A0A1V0S880_CNPV|nr:SWPV1-269 [Shearwaterpox virus]